MQSAGESLPEVEMYTWDCSRLYLGKRHWHLENTSGGGFAASAVQSACPRSECTFHHFATRTETVLRQGNDWRPRV